MPKAADRPLSIQLLQWVIATVDFDEVGLSHVPSTLSSVSTLHTFVRVYIAVLKYSQKSKFFSLGRQLRKQLGGREKKGGVSDVTPPPLKVSAGFVARCLVQFCSY